VTEEVFSVSASVVDDRAARVMLAAGTPSDEISPPPAERGSPRPIVVGVDGSASGIEAVRTGARLARETDAPLTLVYVRAGPPAWLGEPYHQRHVVSEMAAAEDALDDAREVARDEGVEASVEVLEGEPASSLREFVRARDARLVVVGQRRRRLRRSVSRQVLRDATRPVVVAAD